MIDDSQGLVTPHQAFGRILEVIYPDNPDLGAEVTSPYYFREKDPESPEVKACGKAFKFLEAKVSEGKIRAQGERPKDDGPAPINLSELRIGELRVWEGTLEIQNEGRRYRNVFLSLADLNRELGVRPTGIPKPNMAKSSAKLATGADFKFDWDGALIEVMAFLQQNPLPTRPGPIVNVMQDWFKD
jgi:hypothetical protein